MLMLNQAALYNLTNTSYNSIKPKMIPHRYVLYWSLLRRAHHHGSRLLVDLALRPCLKGYALLRGLYLLGWRRLLLRLICLEGVVGRRSRSLCEYGELTGGYLLRYSSHLSTFNFTPVYYRIAQQNSAKPRYVLIVQVRTRIHTPPTNNALRNCMSLHDSSIVW